MEKFGVKRTVQVLGLLLLLLCEHCLAQGGYNYARPEVTIGGGNTANLPPSAGNNAIRPIVGGYPTGSTAAATFPTAVTAYAAGANPTNFGGYAAQPGRGVTAGGFTPTVAAGVPTTATGFAGGATVLPKRPNLNQRPTSGIYGSGSIAGQPTQFTAGAARIGSGAGLDADYDGDFSAIPGVPGVDYPIYGQVPPTNFDCAQQPLPGYYADVEALCQVFHICALNRTYSFLCPNGTIFSQETLVCVWWNQYDCATAPALYANNAYIYDYGNERAPTNAGFQNGPTPVGTRTQMNFPAANAGRSSLPTAGIYGAGSLRPGVSGSSYPSASNQIPSVPNTNFQSGSTGGVAAGRFAASNSPATAAAQAFSNPGSVGTPAPFGAVIRSGVGSVNNGPNASSGDGFNRIPTNAYPNAQVAQSSANREYLPPRRTQRQAVKRSV